MGTSLMLLIIIIIRMIIMITSLVLVALFAKVIAGPGP